MELLNRILSKENLRSAYERVVRNKGSAGVDGIKIDDLKPYLHEHWDRLKEELVAGIYQPQAVMGVKIPKRNGGERLLGIPTTFDRMIQQAIHQELSPLFDPEFSEHSYGFTHNIVYFIGVRELASLGSTGQKCDTGDPTGSGLHQSGTSVRCGHRLEEFLRRSESRLPDDPDQTKSQGPTGFTTDLEIPAQSDAD